MIMIATRFVSLDEHGGILRMQQCEELVTAMTKKGWGKPGETTEGGNLEFVVFA